MPHLAVNKAFLPVPRYHLPEFAGTPSARLTVASLVEITGSSGGLRNAGRCETTVDESEGMHVLFLYRNENDS